MARSREERNVPAKRIRGRIDGTDVSDVVFDQTSVVANEYAKIGISIVEVSYSRHKADCKVALAVAIGVWLQIRRGD